MDCYLAFVPFIAMFVILSPFTIYHERKIVKLLKKYDPEEWHRIWLKFRIIKGYSRVLIKKYSNHENDEIRQWAISYPKYYKKVLYGILIFIYCYLLLFVPIWFFIW